MGVKSLWRTVTPYGDKISIIKLQGKQVAVDLSCWICENKVVGEKYRTRQPNLHLRNIFFRSTVLLMSNVTPVFVLDGDPPGIKQSTISKRNQARFEYGKTQDVDGENNLEKRKGDRKILKYTLRECQQMLSFLGLCCLWSKGEGEAFCALLDHQGVVDGVITQDSDAFLYGARKVYRNFTAQDGFGSVEVYKMSDLQNNLNLSQEKLIAMSLLCGCDYDDTGVHGIGPEKSLKYLCNFEGDILKRLEYLKTDKELERYDSEKSSCKKCHHSGRQQDHTKFGCKLCDTQSKCIQSHEVFSYDSLSDKDKAKVDFELKLRKEVKTNPTFPDKATINEYLTFTQEIPKQNFTWRKPDIVQFVLFMEKKCNWSVQYGIEKIIPLYCRWALLNSVFIDFLPCKILKKRVLKAVPSFDLQWMRKVDLAPYFEDEDLTNIDIFTTIEPQALIIDKCKDLYDDYLTEIKNKKLAKKKGRRGKTAVNDVDNLINCVERLSLGDSNSCQSVQQCEKKKKKKVLASHSTSSDKENIKDSGLSTMKIEENSSIEVILEDKECGFGFDLDDSTTVDYDISGYEIDESLILNNIIARREYY